MFKAEVQKQVERHYEKLVELGYNVVGVFLYGSQNYELDYEKSDVDTKAIVLPTLGDIVLNRQPVSTTVDMGDNCLCDVKDIRKMFECFKKQNINFIELLFTQYYKLNPIYESLYRPMLDNAENIARYNNYASVNCMSGMALEKYNALTHPYPSIKEKIDKYGYDCYSDDTLFLTNNGWKKYDDVTDTDRLATMNPTNLSLEFQPFVSRIKKKTEDMLYEIESYDTRFSVTENHNVFTSKINVNKNGHQYKEDESAWVLQSLNKTLTERGTHKHVIVFPENKNGEYEISDEMLQLYGLYLSEGTINFRDKEHKVIKALRLSQGNAHRTEFHKLADKVADYLNGKKYRYENNNETVWIFSKNIAEEIYNNCGHVSTNKHLPQFYLKLSKRQCGILLGSLMLGDGSFYENRDIYYTSSKQLGMEVCTLALMSGRHSVLMGGEEGFKNSKNANAFGQSNMWHVSIKNRNLSPSYINLKQGRNGNIKNVLEGEKTVVCFEVPNGMLVTMNSGKCATQGNCKQLHHILRLKDFVPRYCSGEIYKQILIPTNREELLRAKSDYVYSLEDAKRIAKETCDWIKEYKDDYMVNNPVVINKEADDLMTKVMTDLITFSIKREVNKDE